MGRVVEAPPAIGLAWAARYSDDRTIIGHLPDELPGGDVPRDGLIRFDLLQGNQEQGWLPILAIELAEHENLVFKRRMQASLLGGTPNAVGLIGGIYDTRISRIVAALYLHGDGTMTLRAGTVDFQPDAHELGS